MTEAGVVGASAGEYARLVVLEVRRRKDADRDWCLFDDRTKLSFVAQAMVRGDLADGLARAAAALPARVGVGLLRPRAAIVEVGLVLEPMKRLVNQAAVTALVT